MIFILFILLCLTFSSSLPNIVILMTDDQDLTLGGMTPMTKTQQLIGKAGATFNNAFVSTPICCPSRSSYLTGHYIHNRGATGNTLGANCNGRGWVEGLEKETFAVYAQEAGYVTQYSGKYMNGYGTPGSPNCSKASDPGCAKVPPGWNLWQGQFGNSRYYNYTVSKNGVAVNHGSDYAKDYFTDLVGNNTVNFIYTAARRFPEKPYLLMVAFPAPHDPRTCAPQYCNNFTTEIAPRVDNWNVLGLEKHWIVRQQSLYTSNSKGLNLCDLVTQQRFQTLLSVDDQVDRIVKALSDTNQLDNTYIFFTSDNGFNLCTFRLLDKGQPYESAIRVPLLVRGPGIASNVELNDVVLNIDLAPTLLELMGITVPESMDGKSYAPLLLGTQGDELFRSEFLVDYHGEFNASCGLRYCPPPPAHNWHVWDAQNNTFKCIRHLDGSDSNQAQNNWIYCEFLDQENFTEYYNLNDDPYQLFNTVSSLDSDSLNYLHNRLIELAFCEGSNCHQSDPRLSLNTKGVRG